MVWCLINLSGEPGAAHSDPTYPLGSGPFQQQIATLVQRRVRPMPLGRPKKPPESGL